ncbi:MAG: hypothetical protein WBE79_06610, partial [Candidatus Cybelea sp.]
MSISDCGRYALSACVAGAMLTACGGSQLANGVVPGASGIRNVASGSKTFSYTGGEQSFTVPKGVTSIAVVALGAGGGSASGGHERGSAGGNGGRVKATLSVTPGEKLTASVGGAGGSAGGFNGGAPGGSSSGSGGNGGGGGGASDLREGGDGLADRVIVAGGGGGGGGFGEYGSGDGGLGGGSIGGAGRWGE